MIDENQEAEEGTEPRGQADRRVRADARRNVDALLHAAKAVFATSGVDAPVREIADRAGVGVATLYRSFPLRSDLIKAVFQLEIDACAEAAPSLLAEHGPTKALDEWVGRYLDFLATKRGLATALHSGDPAYDTLPTYFKERLEPALKGLLDAAADVGEVRRDVSAEEILFAVASLGAFAQRQRPDARRMVALLVDGLRFGAGAYRPQG